MIYSAVSFHQFVGVRHHGWDLEVAMPQIIVPQTS